jgi:anti-sigma factor RsiW
MEGERHAGGLWCHEVLDLLSDYLEGELGPETSASIEAHIQGCDLCERFGGRYKDTVSAIRQALRADDAFDESSAARLHQRLRAAIGSSTAPP